MANTTDDRHPLTGYLIWNLANKWRAAVDRALAPLGLTHAQYVLLASLAGLERAGSPPSQRELADYSGLEPMYVSKLARALERQGMLARQVNPRDPRAYHLTVTPAGQEALALAMARVRALHEQLIAPLGKPDDSRRAELTTSLRTLLQHARALEATDVSEPNQED